MWCKGQIAVVLLLFFLCDAFAQPRFKGRKLIAKQQKPAVVLYANPIEPRAGAPQTVTAQCTDSEVIVTISPDLLGIQKPVQPSDLSMGGCGVTSPAGARPFVIEAPLQGCGSTVEMQGAEIVYTFTLDYNPSPIDGLPIVRTNPAVVQIECHYNRLHNVSSNALNPTWVPYTSTISAEDILGFSLVIMSSDWSGPSPSNTFFLGDLVNLQASVDNSNHEPLRVFVDSCVATPGSNASAPAYTFIGNNGCFLDSQLSGSNSQFVSPRVAQSVMQFQLDAFRFYGLTTSSMQGAEIVYSFTLDYNPSPIDGLPIVRTNPAVVQIECHYNRCFLDSQLTGSNSQFVFPRVAQSVIQFQLDAFRFYGLTTSSVSPFLASPLKEPHGSSQVRPPSFVYKKNALGIKLYCALLIFPFVISKMWCKDKGQIAVVLLLLLFFLCDAFAQPRFKGRHVIAKQQKPAVVLYANPIEPRAGAPQTVTAQCTDSEVIVTISPDLLGIQKPVQPSDLSMGGCGVTSPAGAQPFVIEAPLQGCGSTVEMQGAEIVYSFSLDYNPSPINGLPIVRTNPAVVQIECHYNRLHNVSSNALNPTWVPYTSTISDEDILGFSLVIMSRSQFQASILGAVVGVLAVSCVAVLFLVYSKANGTANTKQ
ncbi:ZP3 protein, partial [Polypterus senegalus]